MYPIRAISNASQLVKIHVLNLRLKTMPSSFIYLIFTHSINVSQFQNFILGVHYAKTILQDLTKQQEKKKKQKEEFYDLGQIPK